jgi:hypothetical protein
MLRVVVCARHLSLVGGITSAARHARTGGKKRDPSSKTTRTKMIGTMALSGMIPAQQV